MMKFTNQHEWIRIEGEIGTVGITAYAQNQLGDVVYAQLPASGETLEKGKGATVVESVKAASEVYAPVSGEVIEVNQALETQPDLINSDPTGAGWFFKVQLSDLEELDALMDEPAYLSYIKELT